MGPVRRIYRLLPTDEGWKVYVSGFPTKAEALRWAQVRAVRDHEGGGLAQVVIHGRDGKMQREWTYGQDPERTVG